MLKAVVLFDIFVETMILFPPEFFAEYKNHKKHIYLKLKYFVTL